MDKEIFHESLFKIGCTTPFQQKNRSLICLEKDKAEKAQEILQSKMEDNTKCPYSCSYLNSFTVNELSTNEKASLTKAFVNFKPYLEKQEDQHIYLSLDLFADLGGYVGIFMGVSLFHVKDLIMNFVMRYMKK